MFETSYQNSSREYQRSKRMAHRNRKDCLILATSQFFADFFQMPFCGVTLISSSHADDRALVLPSSLRHSPRILSKREAASSLELTCSCFQTELNEKYRWRLIYWSQNVAIGLRPRTAFQDFGHIFSLYGQPANKYMLLTSWEVGMPIYFFSFCELA